MAVPVQMVEVAEIDSSTHDVDSNTDASDLVVEDFGGDEEQGGPAYASTSTLSARSDLLSVIHGIGALDPAPRHTEQVNSTARVVALGPRVAPRCSESGVGLCMRLKMGGCQGKQHTRCRQCGRPAPCRTPATFSAARAFDSAACMCCLAQRTAMRAAEEAAAVSSPGPAGPRRVRAVPCRGGAQLSPHAAVEGPELLPSRNARLHQQSRPHPDCVRRRRKDGYESSRYPGGAWRRQRVPPVGGAANPGASFPAGHGLG